MYVSIRESVKDLTAKEAKELASLCRRRFTAGQIRQWEDWTHLLTVRDSETDGLLAFLLLDLGFAESPSPEATIRLVCAGEKGTGLPQMLLKQAETLAKGIGKTTLELELESLSPKLVEVYTKAGFTPVTPDDYIMRKTIGGSRGSGVKKQTRRTQRKRRNTVRKEF